MNLPIEFENRMKELLKDEYEDYISSMADDNIRALRVNTLKGSRDEFFKKNPWGISENDKVAWCPNGFYFKDNVSGKHPYHQAGAFYIQESSAMSVAEMLNIKPGDTVLDLCASPGGKSTQIAAYLDNKGILVSNEPIPERARNLAENIERMGIANSLVISAYPDEIEDRFKECFNKIVVDAPCSGEGMFRKNPEAISEWSVDNVIMCAQRQKDILKSAFNMLSPGGRLVYSTCTFSKEENEMNAEWVLDTFKDVSLIEKRRFFPHKDKGEGHFFAVFEKVGDVSEKADFKCEPGINRKNIKEVFEFEGEALNIRFDDIFAENENYVLFGEEVYILPKEFPLMKGLRVLRSGLHLGTLKKNRFEPSHALALYLKPENVLRRADLTMEEAERFLKGESISLKEDSPKGWTLVCIDGYSLGWGKVSSGMLKNHYPKGLRIN